MCFMTNTLRSLIAIHRHFSPLIPQSGYCDMVVFLLQIKASLENVANISLPDGHEYCIDVKNSTGDDLREGVRVTSANEQDLPGSRGVANFALKWVKDAKAAAYLNVVPVKKITRDYTAQDDHQFVSIIGFECRGMDVVNWHPEDGFQIESTSGQIYSDVDLSDGEWVEYDEKLGESVGIMDLEHRFLTHK